MTLHLGNVPAGTTLYIPFATYDKTNGASVTMTGLAVTDIEIYKNGATTQRASDAGYALLDTDGIDFDGITGLHGFSIDLADNTDAGFYAVGSFYWVVVSTITIDSQTVTFIPATFRIVAAENTAGYPVADAVKLSGDSTAADRLEAVLDAMPSGAVVDDNDPDPTTLLFETDLSEATADHYNGAFVLFYSGVLLGQSRKISDYDGANKIITVANAFTEAPSAGDTFIILGRSE